MKKGILIILSVIAVMAMIFWFSCNPMNSANKQSQSLSILDQADAVRATVTYGDGYCTQNGGTSGGDGGAVYTATTSAEFLKYVGLYTPKIIYVSGQLQLSSQATLRNDTTIIGIGTDASISRGLSINGFNNLIIRNLTINGANPDGLTIQNCKNVWIDHCTFINSTDGQIDIVHGSEWITVSWCKFYYTDSKTHHFVNLIGNGDGVSEDMGKLHVTFHHNWWGSSCVERLPSVRYGTVHCYNNYYNATGNNYCVRTRLYAQVLVENNYFENVKNPWERYLTAAGGTPGKLLARGNNVGYLDTSYGCTWAVSGTADEDGNQSVLIPGTDTVFTPPYSYSLENASLIKDIVSAGAGPNSSITGP